MNWKTIVGFILVIAGGFSFIELRAEKARHIANHLHHNSLLLCALVMILGAILLISGMRRHGTIAALLSGALPLNTLGDEE